MVTFPANGGSADGISTFPTYEGTRHPFFNDTRAEVYDREAAELTFARTFDFFHTNL